MLKRMQLLLADWQEEYLKLCADKFDLSISEVLRILLSEAILCIAFTMQAKDPSLMSKKEWLKIKKEFENIDLPAERRHELISKVYFEAHKIVEKKLKAPRNKRKNKS